MCFLYGNVAIHGAVSSSFVCPLLCMLQLMFYMKNWCPFFVTLLYICTYAQQRWKLQRENKKRKEKCIDGRMYEANLFGIQNTKIRFAGEAKSILPFSEQRN